MKISDINIDEITKKAKTLLDAETSLPPAIKSVFSLLILIVQLLCNRLNLNSSNSSKPPSADPNRKKIKKENKSGKKQGGQNGHVGKNLKQVDNPDEIKNILIVLATLPKGDYRETGYLTRQVINFQISKHVIEYRAQIMEDSAGNVFVAPFPNEVTRPAQYGKALKAHATYLSQFQLLPYNRIEDYFTQELNIPMSKGSLYNFNKEAYALLENFDAWVKEKLQKASVLHGDETGINVAGKRAWLHLTANQKWTYFFPHEKRGSIAMDAIGILPFFKGILCHDHWKPYFIYDCLHALCNAHHLRELQNAFEEDGQQWALAMKLLLIEMNQQSKEKSGEKLPPESIKTYYEKYKAILSQGEKECPPPTLPVMGKKKKRGRIKKSKTRNLLERLINFEKETLRFMEEDDVPFTNNLAENNIRMTKVQQKISGCFRSMEGAYIFCRIRSYISTARKNGLSVTAALDMLFKGEKPDFMNE